MGWVVSSSMFGLLEIGKADVKLASFPTGMTPLAIPDLQLGNSSSRVLSASVTTPHRNRAAAFEEGASWVICGDCRSLRASRGRWSRHFCNPRLKDTLQALVEEEAKSSILEVMHHPWIVHPWPACFNKRNNALMQWVVKPSESGFCCMQLILHGNGTYMLMHHLPHKFL